MKTVLRIISGFLLLAAAVFLAVALTHPEMGTAFRVGDLTIGSGVWRVFYLLYAVVTVGLFTASFFVQNRQSAKRSSGKRSQSEDAGGDRS